MEYEEIQSGRVIDEGYNHFSRVVKSARAESMSRLVQELRVKLK
jgi:hypothetical protein